MGEGRKGPLPGAQRVPATVLMIIVVFLALLLRLLAVQKLALPATLEQAKEMPRASLDCSHRTGFQNQKW